MECDVDMDFTKEHRFENHEQGTRQRLGVRRLTENLNVAARLWRTAVLGLLLPLLAASALAQVTVKLELQKSRFLPRESMLAKLEIVNFSGQTLVFGGEIRIFFYHNSL